MARLRCLFTIAACFWPLAFARVASAELNANLIIAPNPLTFASVRPGGTSGPETLRVSNTASSGGSPISISDVGLTDETDFRIDVDGCSGKTLNPGTFCDVEASFTPTGGRGAFFGGFVVFSNESPIGSSVLEGQVVSPEIALMPDAVDFGNQAVGKSSIASQVTMSNSGDATLSITSIATSAPFSAIDDCGGTLEPGSHCTISAVFTPTVEGGVSGSVSIATDAQTSPDAITLSGTGVPADQPSASFSTEALDFGGQAVNTTSAAQSIEMSNTGNVNLTIAAVTTAEGFTGSDDCGDVLAPGATCAIDVAFSPTAAQPYVGNLVVATNAGDSPHAIALRGFGASDAGPRAVFSQTTVDFGEQALRRPSNPSITTLTSGGSEALVVQSVTKTADSTGSFSGDDFCSGKTLEPGRSCTIEIVFNPQEKGSLGATASVASNAPESPQTLIATGVGVRISGGSCALSGEATQGSILWYAIVQGVPLGIMLVRRRSS